MAEVTANGLRFHYQSLGAGRGDDRLVVFLHGLVMDNLSSWYFTVANPVAMRTEVLLYDLRGHGKTERPKTGYTVSDHVDDLAALLDSVVALDTVDIEITDQVVETVRSCVHDGFPHAPFLQFAVTIVGHNPMFLAANLSGHGRADGNAQRLYAWSPNGN